MHRHRHFGHFAGRHEGGRGPGGRFGARFGRGFADDGDLGGRGFGRGRKLASADLQLMILGLLAEKPCHGYEVIKALDERSKGFYAPSPGMVYPALTYLEEIGHATVEAAGARKLYHLTEAGREYLQEHRMAVDALFNQFERVGERMDSLRRAMSSGRSRDEERIDEGERRGSEPLRQARRALKAAIAGTWNSPREEQERIAAILRSAADDITGKKPRE